MFLLAPSLVACAAQGTTERKACFHLNDQVETEIGYCQAVRSGNLLYISGSTGKGDMPDAMRAAYDKLRRTLQAQGLTFRNVVKETVFTTDLDAFIRNKDVRKEYFADDYPAATWVQIQRLFNSAYVVEVEITAEFPRR